MAVFALGDPHLATGCAKPMDIFAGWSNHVARMAESWRAQVGPQDTVVLAGDISWGMTLQEAEPDFRLLHSLPGRKVLLKGNHDYWWASRRKMEQFFLENRLNGFDILHNSCVAADDLVLCGTRGWMFEEGEAHDRKMAAREEGRLRASLECAKGLPGEKVVLLHYPPLYGEQASGGMLQLLLDYGVRRCYYGHLHGAARSRAFEGEYLGIAFTLVSADHLRFCLKRIG